MRRVVRPIRFALGRRLPRESTYVGTGGSAWCVGFEDRAPSIAAFFCGDDARLSVRGRLSRHRIPGRITDVADAGGLSIVQFHEPDRSLTDVLRRAVVVPKLVDIHTHLPADLDTLRARLLTSTTREDFRRIRRANFGYRITTDPG